MVILATAGQQHEAPMLRKLMDTGVKRPGRGRPRLRPEVVAGDKTSDLLTVLGRLLG